MLRKVTNRVYITGILSENGLETREYMKDGKITKSISGAVKIKVPATESTVEKEIPVQFFANQYTKAGDLSKVYASLEDVMNNYKSIAAVGEEEADWISISGAELTMNEFYGRDGNFVSYPRVRSSFIGKCAKNSVPKSNFECEFYIGKIIEDAETGVVTVKGVVPKYNGEVDVIPFTAKNANIQNGILNTWHQGDTVIAKGDLNFTVKTETTEIEMAIGGPDIRTRTTTVSELVIEKGSEPASDEMSLDTADITAACSLRTAKLEELKNKPKKATTTAATSVNRNTAVDLGF